MIVKNEERTLAACLDSLRGIVDEMIIVDTGSEDRTVSIAEEYGARVEHFSWIGDFAAARNYAFSFAEGDYIYSADADEELDAENRARFLKFKEALASGVIDADIVQFIYTNQLSQDSVYNYDRELRPKLFRRLRPFVWEGAVHEQVRLDPVVYDSDIEIIHRPHGQHAGRDLDIFENMVRKGTELPTRLLKLYARELFMAGDGGRFAAASDLFAERADSETDGDAVEAALLVCLRAARLSGDHEAFFRYALRLLDSGKKSSELCLELGDHYLAAGDDAEAAVWYFSAMEAAEPVLDIRAGEEYPADRLRRLGYEP